MCLKRSADPPSAPVTFIFLSVTFFSSKFYWITPTKYKLVLSFLTLLTTKLHHFSIKNEKKILLIYFKEITIFRQKYELLITTLLYGDMYNCFVRVFIVLKQMGHLISMQILIFLSVTFIFLSVTYNSNLYTIATT